MKTIGMASVGIVGGDSYTKEETYSKKELNNLITTPNQKYESVDAYDSLPDDGEADTIYRVAQWDGEEEEVNPAKYSEYAWDGSDYVLLSVKSSVGDGVFDISMYNLDGSDPSEYDDLADALGSSGANVPASVRAGGMQVKFINSTSGKYEQWRLMAASWSTTVADWQGVDSTPTAGSQNLVTSGGVSVLNEIQEGTRNIFLLYDFPKYSGISLADGVVSGTALSFQNAFGGYKYYPLYREQLKANTRYTVSCYAKTNGASGTTGQGLQVRFVYSDNSVAVAFVYNNNRTSFTYDKATSAENKTLVGIGFAYGSVDGNTWYLKDIQLEEGTTATSYIAPYTAIDGVSRENILLLDNKIDNIEDSDDVPVYNSTRFVKSGGIEKYLAKTITVTVDSPTYTQGAVQSNGTINTSATDYGYVAPIELQSGDSILLNQGEALYHGGNAAVVYECDSSGNFIKALIVGNSTSYSDRYANSSNAVMYIGICCYKSQLKYSISSLEESAPISSFDVLEGIENDKDITLFANNKAIFQSGIITDYPNAKVFAVNVKRGDYLYVLSSYPLQATYAMVSRASSTQDKYDAFIPYRYNVPVHYICENNETLYVTVYEYSSYKYKLVHIKNEQIQALVDCSWLTSFIDVTDFAEMMLGQCWIKYTDGSVNSTGSPIYSYKLSCTGIKKVRAFVSASDTYPAAIAFYSDVNISTSNYLGGVQMKPNYYGGRWFEASVPQNAKYVCFTNHSSNNPQPRFLVDVSSNIIQQKISEAISSVESESKNLDTIYPVASSLPIYSHLFIDKIYNNSAVTIPCQSLFDVRMAAKLGFNLIEINNMKTSDDVWVCRHQVNDGKFEGLINNTNDEVEAVTISEITYSDLKDGYRYNSIVPQYQVPVATLEETLAEIRKYNMQPFIYLYDNSLTNLVKKYFGNRFVAYTSGTSRPESLKGITAYVYSSANTVAGVKAAIDGWGAPYMHGLASPNSFTDEELKELIGYAHSKGCSIGWAGSYSSEASNQHYSDLGLDFSASGWNVPQFDYGNIIDIQGNNINSFSDFTLSGGVTVDSDGTIVLAAGESISASAASKLLGKCLLDVTFKGNIKVTMGQHIVNSQYTENNVVERVFTSIMENEALAFTITAVSESRIYCLDFKGSQVI